MSTTDGRRARGNERRGQVLEEAVRLATIEGLGRFSLDHLASASGVPKGSIQILFKNKAGLQRAIVEAARRETRTKILLPTAEADPGVDRLHRFGQRWVDYMIETEDRGGCFFSSVWTELQSQSGQLHGELHDMVAEDRKGWLAGLASIIDQGVEAGELTSVTSSPDDALAFLGLGMAANAELQFSSGRAAKKRAKALWINQVERLR